MPVLTLPGPTGLGTSAARLFQPARVADPRPGAAEPGGDGSPSCGPAGPGSTGPHDPGSTGLRIPELYCPDPVRDDPALGEEVNRRLVEWAEEIGIYAGRSEVLRSHNFGRLMMLAHPDCDDPDRLLAAARCGLSEWSVDDHYVDVTGPEAEPELIGTRLALANAVVDPARLPAKYEPAFEEVVQNDPVLKAFRSCLGHLHRYATPVQVSRLRLELVRMFVAYGQEGEWRASGRRPPVWEYLVHRYENAFFPCMVLTDPIGGYELPPHEFANPLIRRTYLLAGMATVMLNDIYSMGVEDPTDTNLPTLIAAEENCGIQEAVYRAAELHDEAMHSYESEAAALGATGSPELRRFLTGVWNWMGGAKEWHATTPRYRKGPDQ